MNIEELRKQYLTEVDGSSYLDYTGVKSEQYIQWLEQHLVKLFAIPVVSGSASERYRKALGYISEMTFEIEIGTEKGSDVLEKALRIASGYNVE